MEKYIEKLNNLSFDLLHIAQSFATDNNCPQIEPSHILRALLHKSAGLVNFIEDTLDSDYYYLVDWADLRVQQCNKSPYKMKGTEFSHETKMVIKEAENIRLYIADDFGCYYYLLLCPSYAWAEHTEEEKKLDTREKVDELFKRYIAILTEKEIDIDYRSVENGG